MILRLAAALSLLLGTIGVMGYLQLVGESPFSSLAMRELRDGKERHEAPARIEPVTIGDFEQLPHGLSPAEYSGIERRGVAIEGYVQRMLRATDGDVHLELTPWPRAGGGYDSMYVTAEIPSWWRGRNPGWSFPALAAAFRPNERGAGSAWEQGPSRVRVSGWLLYDFQYDAPRSAFERARGVGRVSGWEIHPVTGIERWDTRDSAWVALR